MMLQFMDRLEKNGKISSDERMRLKDEIETKEGKPSVIDSSDRVQRELRRMKVVNNRDIFLHTFEEEGGGGGWGVPNAYSRNMPILSSLLIFPFFSNLSMNYSIIA